MKKLTFTKLLMLIYSLSILVWITWSYVLASFGKPIIAEDLSSQVVIIGVAAILGYLCKAFFETREEEKIKLEREKLQSLSNNSTSNKEDNAE